MQRAGRGPVRAEAAASAGRGRGRTPPQEFSRCGRGEQKGKGTNFRSAALLLPDQRTKLRYLQYMTELKSASKLAKLFHSR